MKGMSIMRPTMMQILEKKLRFLQPGKPSYQIEASNCWQCGCATNCKKKETRQQNKKIIIAKMSLNICIFLYGFTNKFHISSTLWLADVFCQKVTWHVCVLCQLRKWAANLWIGKVHSNDEVIDTSYRHSLITYTLILIVSLKLSCLIRAFKAQTNQYYFIRYV